MSQLVPKERMLWTSHFLSVGRGFILPVTSTAERTERIAFGQLLIRMRTCIHHHMIRRLVFGEPNHEIE